jgi:uncharacterized membrane protein YdcZ (DUF606 family)
MNIVIGIGVLGGRVGIWTTVLAITIINILGLGIFYVVRPFRFDVQEIVAAPWYLYVGGGILGLFIMGGLVFIFPRIGACYTTITVFLGQICCGVLLDYTGALGIQERRFGLSTLLGFIFIGLGGALLRWR